MPSVAICVLTYQRPAGLRRLLEAIGRLDPPLDGDDIEVVIIDNDASGSGAAVVEAAAAVLAWPVRYAVEPDQGIPLARNRAVRESDGSDFVAFIDDDEVPEPGWLNALLRVQRESGASVVVGPVVPRFERPPPGWVEQGRFFERPRFRTGERLGWATTGNVLIARNALSGPEPFDPKMRYTGGSDTQFFMRAKAEGHVFVWADGAVVMETVPASRMTTRWLVRREFRRGNTMSLSLRSLDDRLVRRLRRAVMALVRVAQGLGQTVIGLRRGRAGVVAGFRTASLGAGMLTGLVNIRYEEYRAHHGS